MIEPKRIVYVYFEFAGQNIIGLVVKNESNL